MLSTVSFLGAFQREFCRRVLTRQRRKAIVDVARRAHPVRGKGLAHLDLNIEGYDPSF